MYMLEYFLYNLWLWKCGLPEEDFRRPPLDDLQQTEWSPQFEQLMRNRLIQGAIRYGRMGHGSIPKGKNIYHRAESIRRRIDRFEKTGNGEYLVDIANIALLMFEERYHPDFYFKSIDDGIHDAIVR